MCRGAKRRREKILKATLNERRVMRFDGEGRVDEVFAAKKSKFKIASGKENAKVIMFFSHLEVVHITVVIIRIG